MSTRRSFGRQGALDSSNCCRRLCFSIVFLHKVCADRPGAVKETRDEAMLLRSMCHSPLPAMKTLTIHAALRLHNVLSYRSPQSCWTAQAL